MAMRYGYFESIIYDNENMKSLRFGQAGTDFFDLNNI